MKLVGIDLACERASAARNWQSDNDAATELTVHVDAGWTPVVVRMTAPKGEPDEWIGGAQAALAPHGRGPGWGDSIGEDSRRLTLKDVLPWHNNRAGSHLDAAFKAAMDAFAADARLVALVVPDDATVDEETQDHTLRALGGSGRVRVELVWRPVAIILGMLNRLPAPDSDAKATDIAVVSDLDGHLAVSRLRLRRVTWAGRVMLAPERKRPGIRWPWAGAAATRVARLRQSTADAIGLTASAVGRQVRQAEALVATGSAARGVVRMPNASWLLIEPPVEHDRQQHLPADFADCLRGADTIIADSPIGVVATRDLAVQLRSLAPSATVLESEDGTTAAGALEAARRFASGAAPWLDFLPGLDAVVIDAEGEAVFDSLIPASEVAPAGRFWVCQNPPTYGLREAQTSIELYFEKRDSVGVRRWTVTLPESAPQGAVVRLRVQQRPATGHAAIVIESDEWGPLRARPIHLDWKDLIHDERDRAQILSDLNTPAKVPNRFYYPSDIAHWADGTIQVALENYVKHAGNFDAKHIGSLHVLYDRFRLQSPPGRAPNGARRHAVDTDGNLPAGLGLDIEALWRHALRLSAVDVETIANGKGPIALREPLRTFYKFPSWCFTACPSSIIEILVSSLRCPAKNSLIGSAADRKVAVHGIGRCMTKEEEILTLIEDWVSGNADGWDGLSIACVAFLTSRREEAAPALAPRPDLVEALARVAADGLREAVGNVWGISVPRYALELSLGLVRVRQVRRSTLTSRTGPGAENLVAALRDLWPRAPMNRRPVIEDAVKWIRGQGANDNILMSLD